MKVARALASARGWGLIQVSDPSDERTAQAFDLVVRIARERQWMPGWSISRVDRVGALMVGEGRPAYHIFVAVKADDESILEEAFRAIQARLTEAKFSTMDTFTAINSSAFNW